MSFSFDDKLNFSSPSFIEAIAISIISRAFSFLSFSRWVFASFKFLLIPPKQFKISFCWLFSDRFLVIFSGDVFDDTSFT